MSQFDANPYATGGIPAAHAAAEARATFLQRTYSLLLAGVLCFTATLWATANIEPVRQMAIGLFSMNPILWIIVVLGAGFGVRAVANTYPINLVAYFAYTFLFGLILAPAVLFAADAMPSVLTQAALLTVPVFTGLTAYVFMTRKDFSFLGGFLWIGLMVMLGLGICGMIFGFSLGLWYSVAGVVLFSGYILYDTSRILHHYPPNAHVAAAIELFVSLILLFQHILHLLMSLNRD